MMYTSARALTRANFIIKIKYFPSQVRILIGLYGNYLLEWFDVFSTDQFLIIKTEEYKNDIAGHLRKVFKFLGLGKFRRLYFYVYNII